MPRFFVYFLCFMAPLVYASLDPPSPAAGVIERYNMEVYASPANNGAYMLVRDFAAFEWESGVPVLHEVPLLADYGGGDVRVVVYCTDYDEAHGHSDVWTEPPVRWAYILLEPWQWSGAHWVPPGGVALPAATPSEVPQILQSVVDALLRNYNWQLVMDAADRSPYGPPHEGAPEE